MSDMDKRVFDAASFTLKPSPEVLERVRSFLNEQLLHHAIDCENIYINTVNNIVDLTLTFSQDLQGLGMDTLEWGTVQLHNDWETGVFSKPWTFQDSHRMHQFAIEDIEQLMRDLLDEAKYKWMV